MINDNAAKYIIINDKISDTEKKKKKKKTFDGTQIYEVIRVINGKLLFAEEHYKRLQNSARIAGNINIPDYNRINEYSRILLDSNELQNCNIKVICYIGRGNCTCNFIMYISKSYYPGIEIYEHGVETCSLRLTRENPNAKISRDWYIEKINDVKKSGNFFEVLLLDEKGFFTEGSKSNLYFVIDNIILTAPVEMILEGIMRKHVFQACAQNGIKILEEPLNIKQLEKVQAAFLSGTSINILPICKIDGVILKPDNLLVSKLRKGFDNLVIEYLRKRV
jgi:branched-chain amino acid aminotransferase